MAAESVPPAERGPTPDSAAIAPDVFAAEFAYDLTSFDDSRARSEQTAAGIVGVSDLHTCREKVRRTLIGHVHTDVPEKWAAIVGTYIDEGVKTARAASRPWLLHDVELTVTLPNGTVLPGHADEIDPQEPAVTDFKTKDALALIRRVGADEQARAQRHLYYLGAVQKGLIKPGGVVRNIFLDRSGGDPHPHVEQEPFSMDVVLAAQAWLEDAQYAAEHGEDALKDWPRPMCDRFCPFVTSCRGGEKFDEEILTGHRALVLAEFVAAKKAKPEITAIYDAARAELLGTSGRSDKHWIKSTVTNGKKPSTRVDAGPIEGVSA